MIFALAAFLLAATEPAMTDGEVWNEGVSFYRDGDVTKICFSQLSVAALKGRMDGE